MKKSNILWIVLGGIVLVVLGFLAGFALNGGFAGGLHPITMMRSYPYHTRGFVGGFGFPWLPMGLGGLLMLVFWLGPIAGIVALIIVLARRPALPQPQPQEQPSKEEKPKAPAK